MRELRVPAITLLLLLLVTSARADPEIRFEEVAEARGLGDVGQDFYAFADYDGDGHVDLLAGGGRLFRNLGPPDWRFENVTAKAGLKGAGGQGAVWADFDGDGHPDFVTVRGQLWRNRGNGTFENVGPKVGLKFPKKCASVGWADVDGDGRCDILVGGGEIWNDGNPITFPQQIWRNVSDSKFQDVSKTYGFDGKFYGRSVAPCDHDADGDVDLYLGNYRLQRNLLYRNDGGAFVEVGKDLGVAGTWDPERHEDAQHGKRFGPNWGHTIGAAWADLNGDGWFDIWTSNLVHKSIGPVQAGGQRFYDTRGYICDDSRIYLNPGAGGGPFTEIRARCGIDVKPIGKLGAGFVGDELWAGAACADFDGDGDVDVYVPQIYHHIAYAHGLLFANRGDATFTEVKPDGWSWPIGCYGAAWADIDADGDLDLVTNGADQANGKRRLHLYINKTEGGRWIGFRLRGAGSNTSAIAARVFLRDGERVQVRQVEGGMGAGGQQNGPVVRFGLGEATAARAVVHWPSGIVQNLGDMKAGRVHEVTETAPRRRPSGEVRVIGEAKAGQPVKLRIKVKGSTAGLVVLWDVDGDNRYEARGFGTEATFPEAGRHLVRALVTKRRGGVGFEIRRFVDVE